MYHTDSFRAGINRAFFPFSDTPTIVGKALFVLQIFPLFVPVEFGIAQARTVFHPGFRWRIRVRFKRV